MIPEAAVEAALSAIFPKGPISDFSRTTWERTVHEILEAAAPHMRQAFYLEMNMRAVQDELRAASIYPRTYSLEDVATEFGIDLDELRKEEGAK